MSGSASLDLERQMLQHTLAIAPMPALGRVYVALCISAPTETAGGTEASGGGYSRTAATFAMMSSPANAASNVASVEFLPATSAWGTIGYFEIWTQPTGGTRLYWGQLVDPADGVPIEMDVTTGDVVRFSAGALIVQVGDTAVTSGVSSFNARIGAVTLESGDVTTALTYTPYNSTNPAGYQTASQVTTTLAPYATTASVAAALAPALNNAGRNLLHNGMMRIAQRGAGPFSVTGYTLDRWKLTVVTDVAAITQIATTDSGRTAVGDEEFTVALKNAFTGSASAGAMNYIQQPIENVRRLAGKTVTVSFWANGDRVLNLGINMFQSFGSGGSPSAGVWATPTVAAIPGTAWARYTKTIAVPSIVGKTLGTNGDDYTALTFFYSAAAGNSSVTGVTGPQTGIFNIWGAQLEIGSVATQLEKPGPGLDFANCQRFFCVLTPLWFQISCTGVQNFGQTLSLPVTMRAAPTITYSGVSYANSQTINTAGVSTSTVATYAVSLASGVASLTATVNASADL